MFKLDNNDNFFSRIQLTHPQKDLISMSYLNHFSAMSIAETSKEPGYGEEAASPLMSSNSYALSHSSSFGGGRGSIGSGSGSGGSHRNSSNSSSLFSQQRTQL